MNTYGDYLANVRPVYGVLALISLLFIASALLLILVLFVTRISKAYEDKKRAGLRKQYQKILSKIIVNESFSEKDKPNTAFEYYMAELRLICGGSAFARHVLVAEILQMKKSLTGNSARALISAYHALRLYRESLRKVRSSAWHKSAMGIRELAEMNCREAIPVIVPFLRSANQTLRKESFMALVHLEEQPLSFLNSLPSELTLWMRVNIFYYLSKIDSRKLPVFSQWFSHRNISIVLFAISMTRQFQQRASIPGLVKLVYSANPKIVGLAITTLGELEAYQHRGLVAKLLCHVRNFEKLARRAIICLRQIGDPDLDVPLIKTFLAHPVYRVRYEAVYALKKFGAKGEAALSDFNASRDVRTDSILRHFSDPLLS